MTASRDISSIVRSWIREEEYDSADRVLQVVLSQLDSAPQRRPLWRAWRSPNMNSPLRYAIAAAAVLVVAVVGYQLIPRETNAPGAPTAPPAASPTIVPTATRDTRPDVPPAGPMDPSTRHFARLEGVGFTFEVPDGWTSNGDFGINREAGDGPDGAGFIFWTENADAVFADPCEQTLAEPVGPSAADLAAAIAEMPQLELVEGPTSVTVGGQPGQLVIVKIPDELPCESDQFYLWGDEVDTGLARYATTPGDTIYVWLIDVDGTRVQIDGETYAGAGAAPREDLQAIVDSIQFE